MYHLGVRRILCLVAVAMLIPLDAAASKVILPGAFCSKVGVRAYAANGRLYECVRQSRGQKARWTRLGKNSISGATPSQVGIATTTSVAAISSRRQEKPTITFPESGKRWRAIDGNASMICAIDSNGLTTCIGRDSYGSNGDGGGIGFCGDVEKCWRVGQVIQTEPFSNISVANDSVCAVGYSGVIYCWGANSHGQLGDGKWGNSSAIHQDKPVPIYSDERFKSVSLGLNGACGLAVSGLIHCWGRNDLGLIGTGGSRSGYEYHKPRPIATSTQFIEVSVGTDFACGVSLSRDVWCWGASWGNGRPDRLSSSVPTLIRGGLDVASISTGHFGGCIRLVASAECWGPPYDNFYSRPSNNYVDVDLVSGQTIGLIEAWEYGCSWSSREARCRFTTKKELRGEIEKRAGFRIVDLTFETDLLRLVGRPESSAPMCALSTEGSIRCFTIDRFDNSDRSGWVFEVTASSQFG
jgi:hypothetical protein